MTGRTLLLQAGQRPGLLTLVLALPPLLALLVSLVHGRGRGAASPWSWVYSALLYASAGPGVAAAMLSGYLVFFTHENLLDQNPVVLLLPILAMLLTLALIRRQADFRALPGVDRLSGAILAIAIAFGLALAISHTRIWLAFGGSIGYFLALVGGLVALLKWGLHSAFRRRDEPAGAPPPWPKV